MTKFFTWLVFLILLMPAVEVSAQGIDFFHGPWKEALEKAKEEGKLIFVDAYTVWCGPCKMIAATLEEVAGEYQGRVKVAKLNIDDNPGTPPKYGIRSIPTLMLFKSVQVEATKVGAVSKAQLTAFLDENL